MSIDGRIGTAAWDGQDCRVQVVPRLERDGHTWSCTGQDSMLIVDCTWEPPFGLGIWGNDGVVHIDEGRTTHVYDRISVGRLRECEILQKGSGW